MMHMEKLGCAHKHKSCPPCCEGKATRAPFKQTNRNRCALLEEVSSDTTGKITPPDGESNNFVQILVQSCSGWTNVQIMRKKSGDGNAIMRSLAKIQRTCEMKAKHLHTEGAKRAGHEKSCSLSLRSFLDSNGKTATNTYPHASQSNYFAERSFRQLLWLLQGL